MPREGIGCASPFRRGRCRTANGPVSREGRGVLYLATYVAMVSVVDVRNGTIRWDSKVSERYGGV